MFVCICLVVFVFACLFACVLIALCNCHLSRCHLRCDISHTHQKLLFLLSQQIQVYPVHFLLELLLRPKFVHLSEGGGPWFDYVWDIVAGAMNSPALLENREKVFTGIVSLARALPPSVYQLVEKFLADRGVEADSQEESQNDSQEEPDKALQEDSDTATQLDSQKDSCKASEETPLEDSHKIAQKDVQEECVVMEAGGEEEEEAEVREGGKEPEAEQES